MGAMIELSTQTIAPLAWASSQMALMSHTSSLGLVGVSTSTSLTLSSSFSRASLTSSSRVMSTCLTTKPCLLGAIFPRNLWVPP